MKRIALLTLISILTSCSTSKIKTTKDYLDTTNIKFKDLQAIINNENCKKDENYFLSCVDALNKGLYYLKDRPFFFTLKKHLKNIEYSPAFSKGLALSNDIFWAKRFKNDYQSLKKYLKKQNRINPGLAYKDEWSNYYRENKESLNFNLFLETLLNQFKKSKYIKSIGEQSFSLKVYNRYLETLIGPYTYLQSREQNFDNYTRPTKVLHGIGINYFYKKNGLLINKVQKDGPAYRSKLYAGDLITSYRPLPGSKSIDLTKNPGKNETGKIKGELKSIVEVTLKRNGKEIEKSIIRDKVFYPPMEKQYLNQNNKKYTYLRIDNFYGKGFCSDLNNHLKKLSQTDGLILDLRNNGGGRAKSSYCLAEYFLESGKVIAIKKVLKEDIRNINDIKKVIEITSDGGKNFRTPIIVLVNQSTASASETTAMSLQQNNRAIVIGEKTTGKGWGGYFKRKHKEVPYLNNNRDLSFYSISYFIYGPNNNLIAGSGVTPDLFLKSSPNQKKLALKSEEEEVIAEFNSYYRPSFSHLNSSRQSASRLKKNKALKQCLSSKQAKITKIYNKQRRIIEKFSNPDYLSIQAIELFNCMKEKS